MEKDKNHLQNIDKVEVHNHNHIDTTEILNDLNILKLQNHKILTLLSNIGDTGALEKQMDSWLQTLGTAIGKVEKVSNQV